MSTTPEAQPLPELSEERVDEVERAVFAAIYSDRSRSRARRRRGWTIGLSAAAAVVVVVAIAPSIGALVVGGGGTSSGSSAQQPITGMAESGRAGSDTGLSTSDIAVSPVSPIAGDTATLPGAAKVAERDVIANGSATVRVQDVAAAVKALTATAGARGGFVESQTVGVAAPEVNSSAVDVIPGYPVPAADGSGWVTVRVPADQLSAAIADLSALGDVEASSISKQDVTDQTVDLRARIDATQASVERLTALMSQAANVTDLIAAEGALAERQANLESYQQQLASLEGQVSMSSLTVTMVPRTATVSADAAGFGDGIAAGWNGLVATLNGLVIGLGFLLPWIIVIAVIGLIVWGIIALTRVARRRRRTRATETRTPPAE